MSQVIDPGPQIALPHAAVAKPPAISTQQLTKRYGVLTALDSLTLDLESGDCFGFIGPNGAGKSTTMKILAGLLEPTSGTARVMGRKCDGERRLRPTQRRVYAGFHRRV